MSSKPKQAEHVVSLDIGSTFTKAALFQVESDCMTVCSAARVPTTTHSLEQGVRSVLASIGCFDPSSERPAYPVYFSSSAKGGLHVVAVGLVPELTLKVAKLTALSAGARVMRSYGYKLTESDIQEIDQLSPDIILFSGGTDGGNETYVRHNGSALSGLKSRPQIIYAGNQAMRDEVAELLSDFSLHLTDNILPDLDHYCVDAARKMIGDVFLKTIVSGKGLDTVIKLLDGEPLPTPLAVMQLVEAIARTDKQWTEFCLVDMGGATTDFYSCSHDSVHESHVVYRGLPEPDIKRTVEGDLGIRCNAASVLIAGSQMLQETRDTGELLDITDYINKVTQQTDYLPKALQERRHDRMLAEICMACAIQRHAGTRERVFTAQGEVFIQTGKDLRGIRKMILTGGFLSSLKDDEELMENWQILKHPKDSSVETVRLLPNEVDYYQDKDYLLPLLGNLVRFCPDLASRTAIDMLKVFETKRSFPEKKLY